MQRKDCIAEELQKQTEEDICAEKQERRKEGMPPRHVWKFENKLSNLLIEAVLRVSSRYARV